jgi:hypothetical protein
MLKSKKCDTVPLKDIRGNKEVVKTEVYHPFRTRIIIQLKATDYKMDTRRLFMQNRFRSQFFPPSFTIKRQSLRPLGKDQISFSPPHPSPPTLG